MRGARDMPDEMLDEVRHVVFRRTFRISHFAFRMCEIGHFAFRGRVAPRWWRRRAAPSHDFSHMGGQVV